jgi:mono/diheme cytochrome c family protein
MKRILLLLTIFTLILGFSNCQRTAESEEVALDEEQLALGFQLIESNCFTCHSPNAGMQQRIAPPMVAVKRHYVDSTVSAVAFTEAIKRFVLYPDTSYSKMPGAIDRFGLMPKMNFSETQLEAIAYYIYHTELEQPGWFEKHYQEEHKKHMGRMGTNQSKSYLERGQQYAMATKAVLGKNLLGAINEKGSTGAVAFCNTRAIPLTDSMQQVQQVQIKRVSNQNRNPDNQANADELAYIQAAKAALQNGETIRGKVAERNGHMVGYYPIITNDMCLQCHGDPESDISPETLSKIQTLYPNDQATGYKANELRGIWVVEMPKKGD